MHHLRIIRESDGLYLTFTWDKIILNWESSPLEVQVSHSLSFKWKGEHINFTVTEYNGKRSNTLNALVQYKGNNYSFGFGRNALGAGAIGEKPNITLGNNKLKFDFGKKCISISDTVIDENLELMNDKESNFLLIV